MFRLPTINQALDPFLAIVVYDMRLPSVANPLNTFFGDAVFLLVNVGRNYFKGYRGKECIVYMSYEDYSRVGGVEAQYLNMYYDELHPGTAHIAMTFANDGTIAVLGNDSHVEVITVDGQWNSSTAHKTYYRSTSAFLGVRSILFTNDTELAFGVWEQTLFDVPFFQYSLQETLTMDFNSTQHPLR